MSVITQKMAWWDEQLHCIWVQPSRQFPCTSPKRNEWRHARSQLDQVLGVAFTDFCGSCPEECPLCFFICNFLQRTLPVFLDSSILAFSKNDLSYIIKREHANSNLQASRICNRQASWYKLFSKQYSFWNLLSETQKECLNKELVHDELVRSDDTQATNFL